MTKKTPDRRSRIIAESIHQIDRNGVSGMTARSVAKRLKIPSSAVFYYFPTHGDLFLAAQQFAMDEAEKIVGKFVLASKSSGPVELLQAYVKGTIEWAFENPSHVKVLTNAFVYSAGKNQLSAQHQLTTARGIEKIYHWLAVAVAEGAIPKLDSLRMRAELIHSALTGACMKMVIGPPKESAELVEFQTMFWTMVSKVLDFR